MAKKGKKHTGSGREPLTERDRQILKAIHEFDGMLGAEQIQHMFFGSWHRTRLRLSKLYKEGYVNRPDRKTRVGLPQMVYWLTRKGAEVVAGMYGRTLASGDFKWRGKPRWSLIAHDLEVNEFRMAVMAACYQLGYLSISEWVPSGDFWARPDRIEYADLDGKMQKRGVRPDGYFVLYNHQTGRNVRCLLELDKDSNEDLRRIADEKVLPGLAYLRSETYQQRAQHLPGERLKSGRWLFVISTADAELRLENMKHRIEQIAKDQANKFWLTTLVEAVKCENVLTAPIWRRGGEQGSGSLF